MKKTTQIFKNSYTEKQKIKWINVTSSSLLEHVRASFMVVIK